MTRAPGSVGVKRSPFKGIVQSVPSPDMLLGGRKGYEYRGCWMQERMLGAVGEGSGGGCVRCRGSPPRCASHPGRGSAEGQIMSGTAGSQHLHQQLHSRWPRSHWLVTSRLHELQPQRLPRQHLASLGKPDPDISEPKDSRLSH